MVIHLHFATDFVSTEKVEECLVVGMCVLVVVVGSVAVWGRRCKCDADVTSGAVAGAQWAHTMWATRVASPLPGTRPPCALTHTNAALIADNYGK